MRQKIKMLQSNTFGRKVKQSGDFPFFPQFLCILEIRCIRIPKDTFHLLPSYLSYLLLLSPSLISPFLSYPLYSWGYLHPPLTVYTLSSLGTLKGVISKLQHSLSYLSSNRFPGSHFTQAHGHYYWLVMDLLLLLLLFSFTKLPSQNSWKCVLIGLNDVIHFNTL